jgi:hypothetical protein
MRRIWTDDMKRRILKEYRVIECNIKNSDKSFWWSHVYWIYLFYRGIFLGCLNGSYATTIEKKRPRHMKFEIMIMDGGQNVAGLHVAMEFQPPSWTQWFLLVTCGKSVLFDSGMRQIGALCYCLAVCLWFYHILVASRCALIRLAVSW